MEDVESFSPLSGGGGCWRRAAVHIGAQCACRRGRRCQTCQAWQVLCCKTQISLSFRYDKANKSKVHSHLRDSLLHFQVSREEGVPRPARKGHAGGAPGSPGGRGSEGETGQEPSLFPWEGTAEGG